MTYTPRASSASAMCAASAASPSITGMIGCSPGLRSKPAAASPARKKRVWSRALPQPLDHLAPGGHESTTATTQGLAEGAGDDVDALRDAALLGSAAARRTHEAGGVRVIDHHQRVVAFGEVTDLAQLRDEPVHREHAVARDEPGARPGRLFEALLELRHVAVGVAVALRLAQADAVDDARVVEGIGDHGIALIEKRFEQPAVGIEARGIQDHILAAEVTRQARLQRLVNLLRATDEAHRGHAVTELIERTRCRGAHPGVVREAKVVVGAEVDDIAIAGVHHG